MDTLTSLRVFCTVAELKSFTSAADRLGVSPAMASKHVMRLENRLGTRLLNRTSRHVSLTETGRLYFNQTREMLERLDEVEDAIGNVTVAPRGTLKLSAPVWAATGCFTDMLAAYNRRYPDVCLDLDLSGRLVNLVDEGFDLALRATSEDRLDPGLVARPLTNVQFRLMGSPDYLERTGRPQNVAELNGHALLRYSGVNFGESMSLEGPDGPHKITFRTVMLSDNETIMHLAALRGMGLAFLPKWMAEQDIEAGRLEIVLPAILLGFNSTLYAVYPSRKYLSAKVRTFIDFLTVSTREMG
ncbi:DNA-binding transcriptional LysR family regulator [Rhizobium leguminosarum]|uniref:HTH-type transcriptional regulator TtuA n=1 Tax=Rhizobium leguminosarum TaxID=384 RepID=A0AAE2SZ13_RHILE|nr:MULTISPECIES: LysR family transcriptional regulator [Rhizobium]MBB4292168.1 DNA-binding transcriptional LysR family regulator [Rhizobium leguminosarum]MBB4299717.1 DNA-binding transcriptional LysR family regulator [Rhizobium leguminosarum]MBB4309894.1 DNA-binding transcriptional LysR family regulator [Rhizobium leguminosarum]MBB4419366.1 DNA-binding transcriptional LysR family regulator [Rhizobium leguminosarum]MBB4434169.1 DNA-binding transcriptional LysR family regulator [Rhizobium espera